MSDSQRKGRLRLRHLLEVTEAAGEEMDAERGRFDRLADPASAPRVVSAFNLFQTPELLAARLVDHLDGFGSILEPSAGLGRIYRAIRAANPGAACTLVEIAADCCAELYRATEGDAAARLVQGDFLACTVERLGLFDAVAMNPPFKMGTDVKHIRHALGFLKPGGRLVTLCADGPKQRAALQPLATSWESLPAGSFKSEGTNVAAALCVIDSTT
jgi:16S rRNA G1207 methylase RsmC